jgi:transposase-like protein
VADKDSRPVVTDLKRIDQAPTLADAERGLETLAERWDHKYPSLSALWLRHWD